MLAECANDPGTLRNTPDCVNARQAGSLESIGSLRDLPPLQLSTERGEAGESRQKEERDAKTGASEGTGEGR